MTTLKTWFRRLRTLLWTALALVIIGAAVLVGIGKLLMPYSERFKPRLEAVLAEQFNQPVRLDAFTGEWKAFGPRISLEGVTLLGSRSGQDAIAIEQAALDIRPLNAFISGRPLYSFRIIGADLALVRLDDGRFELSGLGLSGRQLDGKSDPGGLGNLARVGEVRLEDSAFSYSDATREMHLQLVGIDGRLQVNGDRLALEVQASVSDAGRERVLGDLAATVLAGLDARGRLDGLEFHLETGELMLHELAAQLPDHSLRPASGRLNAQLWGSWAPGQPQEMAGVVDIRDAGLDTGDRMLLLDHANARLNWRWRDKTQWRIDLADMRVTENGRRWTAPRVSVERNLEGNLAVWVSADFAEAEFPLEITQVIMGEFGSRWPKAVPTAGSGPVHDFDLVINGNRKLTATSGRFENLEVLAWADWPLPRGLNGRIDLAYGEGSLHFAGEDVAITWERNFRAPLVVDFEDCEMEILWVDDDYWQVDALPCPIRNEHLDAEARARFAKDEGKPRVDVNAALHRADLAELSDYWPASVMSPKVTDWLRRSIVSGTAENARFLLQGDMDAFPFRDSEGAILATAQLRDARLAYSPGWPEAGDVNAALRIEGASLSLSGSIGDLAGGQVQQATARIRDLQTPRMELDYRSTTDLPALESFLAASPLLRDTELDPADFAFQGGAVTRGRLVLPFGDTPGDFTLDGRLELREGQFTHRPTGVRLDGLAGTLEYDGEGVETEGLTATLDGWPATLDLDAAWGTDTPFSARLAGRFPASALASAAPLDDDPLLSSISGEADWDIGLDVSRPETEAPMRTRLTASSNLEGMRLGLPAPLAKDADTAWPFELSWATGESADEVHARLGDRATLALELGEPTATAALEAPAEAPEPADEAVGPDTPPAIESGEPTVIGPALRRGALAFGAGPAEWPAPGEFSLGGEAETLDIDAWMDVVTAYGAADRYPTGLAFRDATVDARELVLMNRAFNDVRLDLAWDGQALAAGFDGAAIDGDVAYTRNEDGTHVLNAQFERLYMPDPLDAGMAMDADPTGLPEMHFFVSEFQFMGLDLGATRIEAFPIANGLRIETVDAASEQLTFQARGDWVVTDGASRSDFDIVLTSESLGALVEALDLSSVLEGGQTMLRYDAWWPGPPAAFELARLNGLITFSVIDGRILNADPGAGRVLGLMSVGALPRRLSLDFSDVFESGLTFDQAQGTIRLDSGTAWTDDFILESTAARLAITGSSDLEAQQFDYQMTVRPGVSQALPVLGAIAGGPAGAAAGLALQGLLREALGDATEARYEITGPWSDPEVVRLPSGPATAPPANGATDNFTASTPDTEDS